MQKLMFTKIIYVKWVWIFSCISRYLYKKGQQNNSIKTFKAIAFIKYNCYWFVSQSFWLLSLLVHVLLRIIWNWESASILSGSILSTFGYPRLSIYQLLGSKFSCQKQLSRGVPRKRCSENMYQIYRRAIMTKCDFYKVAK